MPKDHMSPKMPAKMPAKPPARHPMPMSKGGGGKKGKGK